MQTESPALVQVALAQPVGSGQAGQVSGVPSLR
jgi:hypothetical protein